jgi:hypothetical protein
MHAAVTSGSERDPRPIGSWTVSSIVGNPVFNYNPSRFWDADPSLAKAKVPPDWDALRLAAMVGKGTKVKFVE